MLIHFSSLALLTYLVGFLGCLTKEDLGDPAPTTSGGTISLQPLDGIWTSDDVTQVDNTCSPTGPEAGAGTLGLQVTNVPSDSTFSMFDGETTYRCTVDGADFVCARSTDSYPSWDYPDVVFTEHTDVLGILETETSLDADWDVTTECAGGSCSTVESSYGISFPCTAAYTLTLALE